MSQEIRGKGVKTVMEFEAAIGQLETGFLVFSITPDQIVVKRVRYIEMRSHHPRQKVVEPLLTRRITTYEEKGRIYTFLHKMGTYLKDAEERYACKSQGVSTTSWCFILWIIKEVYYSSGEDAYPPWWEEACTAIKEVAGFLFPC